MTFDELEVSNYSGAPYELYEFSIGSATYRYTSSIEQEEHLGNIYTPVPITRNAIELGQQLTKTEVIITTKRDSAVAAHFIAKAPSNIVSVAIFKRHIGTTLYQTAWMGVVLNAAWEGGEVRLHCEPISVSLKRLGLTRATSIACPYQIYGSECGVSRSSYEFASSITNIVGAVITVTDASLQVDGYYDGGLVKWVSPDGVLEYFTVQSHVADDLELIRPSASLNIGDNVSIYPGCNRAWANCTTKFNNGLTYGGQLFMPIDVNPFNDKVF